MSGRYHKVKHQRLSKSTHFQETNVTMKPLNDPIPPNHPGSPEPPIKRRTDGGRGGERYLNIDLSGSTLPKRKIEHLNPDVGQQDPESHKKSQTTSRGKSRSTYSETLFEEYQDLPVKYSLSQKTRRLLQEVDNISKMYLAGKDLVNFDDPPSSLENPSTIITDSKTEKENSGMRKRSSTKRSKVFCEISDELVSGIGAEKIVVKQKPLEYKINDLEKSPTVKQQKVEEKPQKRSITKITNQLVSKNLKSRHVSTEAGSTKPAGATSKSLDSNEEKVLIEKSVEEKIVMADDLKPWRKNMKKSDEKFQIPESPTKCTCTRSQDPEVRGYIKAKRKLRSQQDKKKAKDTQESLNKIKDALLALEVWRKNNAQQPLNEKVPQTSKLEEEIKDANFVKKEKNLRALLEKLTSEMRSKYNNDELLTNTITDAQNVSPVSSGVNEITSAATEFSPLKTTQKRRSLNSSKSDQRVIIEDKLRKFVSSKYTSPTKSLKAKSKLLERTSPPKSLGKPSRVPVKSNQVLDQSPKSKKTLNSTSGDKIEAKPQSVFHAEKVFETSMTQTQSQHSDEVDSVVAREYLSKKYPQLLDQIEKVEKEEKSLETKDTFNVMKPQRDVSEKYEASQNQLKTRIDFESLKMLKTTFQPDPLDASNYNKSIKSISPVVSISKRQSERQRKEEPNVQEDQVQGDPVSRQSTYASISLRSSSVGHPMGTATPLNLVKDGSENLDEKRTTSEASNQVLGSDLRSKVATLQERHRQDLKMIKSTNVNILSPNSSLNLEKLIVENPESESQNSKGFINTDPPEKPLKMSDPFNFLSTVQRKLEDEMRRTNISTEESRKLNSDYSAVISEGPLSNTLSSVHSNVVNSTKQNQEEIKCVEKDALFIPTALKLRFQAELNQMEGIQEAERQLNNLNHIREVVTVRKDAAAVANLLRQGLGGSFPTDDPVRISEHSRKSRSSSVGGETRGEFEARMKLYVEELLNKRTKDLLYQQTEATRATADAARQLSKIFRSKQHKLSTSSRGSAISNDLLTLMSKTDSKFSEVMSVAERTEKSGSSIRKTISEAIRTISVDDPSTNSIDITEDIAGDLSSTITDVVSTVVEQEKMQSNRKVRHGKSLKNKQQSEEVSESSLSDEKCSTQTSSIESFSKFAGKLSYQNYQEQLISLQHKITMIDNREKLLDERFKREMARAQDENDSEARQKKLILNYKQSKAEFGPLRSSLKAEIRDTKFYISQQKKLAKEISTYKQYPIDIDRYLSPSPTTSLSLSMASNESKVQKSLEGSKKRSTRLARLSGELKLSIGSGPPLKMPLSPNSTGKSRFRNLSGPESDDSIIISQAETVSDHSDLEIRISALESDLRGHIRQSEKLKRGHKRRSYNSDQLKPLEESRIPQINALDMIITSKKAELDEVVHQQGQRSPIVQPIIKTPKSSGRLSFSSQLSVESIEPGDISQRTVSSMSGASSTDTVMASPKKLVSEEMHEVELSFPGRLGTDHLGNEEDLTKEQRDLNVSSEKISSFEIASKLLDGPKEVKNKVFEVPERKIVEKTIDPSLVSKEADDVGKQIDRHRPISGGGDGEESLESIQDQIESTSQHIEADLNYSDDFTSSSASELAPTNLVIKTTVLAKHKLDGSGGIQPKDVATDFDKSCDKIIDAGGIYVKRSREEFAVEISERLLEQIINEAVKIVSKVKKRQNNSSPIRSRKNTLEQNIHTYKSSSPLSRTPIQNLMLTTFDVSSDSSQESGSEENVGNPPKSPTLTFELDRPFEGLLDHGDFIDDDFGLSIRQESEKLRQQQLLVEEEISRIQQEEREIPNKPPPPYTPPSPTKVVKPRPVFETPKYVPSSKHELSSLVPGLVLSLLASNQEIHAKLKKDYTDCHSLDSTIAVSGPSRDKFVTFLADLVSDIFQSIFKCESESQNPPWLPQKPLLKQRLSLPSTVSQLIERIVKEVSIAFHHEKRAAKENLVVRWSQKRRDRVDQILVRELHSEEASWTDYSADEVVVKNQVAEGILEDLLGETSQTFCKIFQLKEKSDNTL